MSKPKKVLIVCTAFALASCASGPIVTSTPIAHDADHASSTSLYYALPRVKSQLQLKRKGDVYALQSVADVAGPDPNYIYMIRYDQSHFADDIVKVITTADGLLSSIDVTNEDKSGAFLVQIAEAAKQGLKAGILFDTPDPADAAKPEVLVADMLVDLTDDRELKDLNAYLQAKKSGITVTVEGAQKKTVRSAGSQGASCTVSVCYRPKLAYVVTIDDAKQNTRKQQMLYSPNHAPLLSLDIVRASFVKRVTNVTFDKGMITGVTVNKPSEAVGFMSIPIDVLKAIVSIPAELVQLKIDTSTKDKNLVDAQKALLQAQEQLIAARKQAADAAAASGTP